MSAGKSTRTTPGDENSEDIERVTIALLASLDFGVCNRSSLACRLHSRLSLVCSRSKVETGNSVGQGVCMTSADRQTDSPR